MRDRRASHRNNRRQEPRYPGQRKAVVRFGRKQGTVIDVSKGGIAILLESRYIFPGYTGQIDIAWAAHGFFLGAVPVRAISHYLAVEEPLHPGLATRCGLAFDVLRVPQRFKLDYFIWLCNHPRR